jgi:hypothetical protein
MFRFLLASFQWLVFGGTSIKAFPSLLWRLLVPPTKYTHPKPLWALPNPSLWGSCDLWENLSGGLREFSLWALKHLSFVKQSLWHLLLLEMKPPRRLDITLELPRLWWAVEKFVNVCFTSERKEARASEVRKAVERDPAWSLNLVGNSSYLNGDVGITGGDFELWQTNSHINCLVCLLMFLLSKLLESLIISIDSIGCVHRLLYLWSIYCN